MLRAPARESDADPVPADNVSAARCPRCRRRDWHDSFSWGLLRHDELVVGEDASPVVENEKFKTDGGDFAPGSDHLPIERDDAPKRLRIFCGSETVASVPDVLLV